MQKIRCIFVHATLIDCLKTRPTAGAAQTARGVQVTDERFSITIRTMSEMTPHACRKENQHARPSEPGVGRADLKPMSVRIMSLKSSASCECASESAHSRRYDAVFEMEPSTNSMVWMAWWMKASPNENSSPCSSSPSAPVSFSSTRASTALLSDLRVVLVELDEGDGDEQEGHRDEGGDEQRELHRALELREADLGLGHLIVAREELVGTVDAGGARRGARLSGQQRCRTCHRTAAAAQST